MKTNLLKAFLKYGGMVALGVSSVWTAIDTDKKTQEFVKKLAEKSVSAMEKKES